MTTINSTVGKMSRWAIVPIIVMIIGIALFLLTPFFIRYLNFDSDIPGVLVLLVGILLYVAGLIVRAVKKRA